MPTLTIDLDILDSRASWFRTMARITRGEARATWSARADLARKAWRRAQQAREQAAPYGWAHAG